MSADYQSFDLSGSHYDLGLAQGARTERFEIPPWWPAPPELAFAEACARQIAEIHPPLMDELQGYADGQRLPYEELLRGVCRRTMRLRARVPAVYPEGGCSSFAMIDADGHVRVGAITISIPCNACASASGSGPTGAAPRWECAVPSPAGGTTA